MPWRVLKKAKRARGNYRGGSDHGSERHDRLRRYLKRISRHMGRSERCKPLSQIGFGAHRIEGIGDKQYRGSTTSKKTL